MVGEQIGVLTRPHDGGGMIPRGGDTKYVTPVFLRTDWCADGSG